MIDLHSHILPGIDDGAKDLEVAVEMARLSVADGVSVLACTPHIMPGVYGNTGPQIRAHVAALQNELDQREIPLRLVTGSDAHMVADMVEGLRSGRILSLADTRYVLVEPPHHIQPQSIQDFFFKLMLAGYQPILTHPERLHWIETGYDAMVHMADNGVWMQITAGSLTGAFGRRPLYWAERMLDEARVHILASDAHSPRRRPPNMGAGRDLAAKRVGDDEALNLVYTRPKAILDNAVPGSVAAPQNDVKVKNATAHKSVRPAGDVRTKGHREGAPRSGLRRLVSGVQRFFR